MALINNLSDNNAIDKIKEIAGAVGTCMLCTKLSSLPFNARPMSIGKIDEEGKFWFMSSAESDKNMEIQQNDQVHLIFSDVQGARYLNVYGEADIFTDQKSIDETWTAAANAWFPQGKETPGLTVIKVHPYYAHYWDTKDSKMITLLKMAAAAISGKPFDDAVEGELTVKIK